MALGSIYIGRSPIAEEEPLFDPVIDHPQHRFSRDYAYPSAY